MVPAPAWHRMVGLEHWLRHACHMQTDCFTHSFGSYVPAGTVPEALVAARQGVRGRS